MPSWGGVGVSYRPREIQWRFMSGGATLHPSVIAVVAVLDVAARAEQRVGFVKE